MELSHLLHWEFIPPPTHYFGRYHVCSAESDDKDEGWRDDRPAEAAAVDGNDHDDWIYLPLLPLPLWVEYLLDFIILTRDYPAVVYE